MDKKLKRAYYLYRTYKLNNEGFREYGEIAESMGLTRGELNARMNRRWNDLAAAQRQKRMAA